MPQYTYRCDACECVYDMSHSMKETMKDCEQCNQENSLVRVPSINFINTTVQHTMDQPRPGALVEEHIREGKKELRKEKQNLQREMEVKPNE